MQDNDFHPEVSDVLHFLRPAVGVAHDGGGDYFVFILFI
jgi:hypothetical protein